jgi:hypothetical protein
MRTPTDRIQALRDLRFALEVMEERSHLGLDSEAAKNMKKTILNRISEAEKEIRRLTPVAENADADKALIA